MKTRLAAKHAHNRDDLERPKGARILVIEDEESIRRGLCDVLAFNGYQPEGVERGDHGLESARERVHTLILLDVMLPGIDGFSLCRTLRDEGDARPVLMLTARGREEDVLEGFRSGADDYVTKPFSVAELMARTEALLRRAGALEEVESSREAFDLGPWRIEPDTSCATRDDASVELTPREIDVLWALVSAPGRIVSRRHLLASVWGYPDPDRVETRTVDMHIAKLRKKLDPARAAGSLIETVRGEGYRVLA